MPDNITQTNKTTPLCFGAVTAGGRVASFVRDRGPQLRPRGMIVLPSVHTVKCPRGKYRVYAFLSIEAATPENIISENMFIRRGHPHAR